MRPACARRRWSSATSSDVGDARRRRYIMTDSMRPFRGETVVGVGSPHSAVDREGDR